MATRHRWTRALLALVVALSSAIAGWATTSTAPRPTPKRMAKVPRVDAQITGIAVSPDNTRVALWLKRRVKAGPGESDPSYAYSVGCLDVNARKMLGVHAVRGTDPLLKWSPDSRWLLASMHEESLTLVDRDGKLRALPRPGSLRSVAWRADADGIAYCTWSDKTGVYEQAVDPRIPGKRHAANGPLVGLFNVQGKLCYGYLHPSGEPGEEQEIRAARLGEAHPFLQIPITPELQERDCYWLDVSPDGRFFQFACVASAGVTDVIARTEDAAAVLAQPHLAVLYQYKAWTPYRITWPEAPAGEAGHGAANAVVEDWTADGISFEFLLDLRTGSRYPASDSLGDPWAAAAFWKRDAMLVVIPQGLAESGIGSHIDPYPMLLYHQPVR